ncbi:hypothetical protein ACKVMT_06345 [Halobacteriales archaeon Cl-PHB]
MTEMAEVDHTHPHTGEPFEITFRRGVTVAADGGRHAASDGATDSMADVTHEAATEGANRSFERGTEGRNETV